MQSFKVGCCAIESYWKVTASRTIVFKLAIVSTCVKIFSPTPGLYTHLPGPLQLKKIVLSSVSFGMNCLCQIYENRAKDVKAA